MAITSSTFFIRHMQIRRVGFTTDQSHSFWAWSDRLMTTTTTDTCLVHQTEAHNNHCVVGKSEMCLARSDLQCSDYHVFNEIMVNVPSWMKMFAQMRTTWILSNAFKYTTVGLSGLLRLAPHKETLHDCRERSEYRMKARQEWIDHHDTVETWKPGAVMIGLFTPIQAITIVEGR